MYRLRIETIDQENGEAAISVEKVLDEDTVRHVLISMMQYASYKANLVTFAQQRLDEHAKRLDRHDGDKSE